jgi:hypothetical protein
MNERAFCTFLSPAKRTWTAAAAMPRAAVATVAITWLMSRSNHSGASKPKRAFTAGPTAAVSQELSLVSLVHVGFMFVLK